MFSGARLGADTSHFNERTSDVYPPERRFSARYLLRATKLGLNPAALCLTIRELVDDDATIACDIGSNYIFMARHLRVY